MAGREAAVTPIYSIGNVWSFGSFLNHVHIFVSVDVTMDWTCFGLVLSWSQSGSFKTLVLCVIFLCTADRCGLLGGPCHLLAVMDYWQAIPKELAHVTSIHLSALVPLYSFVIRRRKDEGQRTTSPTFLF